jgi:hypothetical protein
MNQGYRRQVLDCAGRAQRRRRFQTRTQRGVAPAGAGLPPQSKNVLQFMVPARVQRAFKVEGRSFLGTDIVAHVFQRAGSGDFESPKTAGWKARPTRSPERLRYRTIVEVAAGLYQRSSAGKYSRISSS